MNLTTLKDTPPWEWPEGTAATLLGILSARANRAAEAGRESPRYTRCGCAPGRPALSGALYAAEHVDFPYFNVDSLTAPVTHAGQPMVESPVSFFLAAIPDMGYKLYVLVPLPTPFGPVLASRSLPRSFSKPSRGARQPGSSVAIDTSDGNITSSPYFDGTRLWFTHVVDEETFPTVR